MKVTECGLFVDLTNGQLAGSPDRLVEDEQSSDPSGIIDVTVNVCTRVVTIHVSMRLLEQIHASLPSQ